jgi:hypothetical protein
MERDSGCSDVSNEGFVNREPRARVDDLVAGVAVGLLCESDGHLCAGKDDDAVRRYVNPSGFAHGVCDGLAKRKNSLRIVVVGEVVVNLPLDLFGDVSGQREIGLSEVASHDLVAGVLELLYEWTDLERVLGVEHRDAIREERSRLVRRCGSGGHRSLPSKKKAGTRAPERRVPVVYSS